MYNQNTLCTIKYMLCSMSHSAFFEFDVTEQNQLTILLHSCNNIDWGDHDECQSFKNIQINEITANEISCSLFSTWNTKIHYIFSELFNSKSCLTTCIEILLKGMHSNSFNSKGSISLSLKIH